MIAAVLLLAVLAGTAAFAVGRMRELLYREQASGLRKLMEKIGQNISLVLENRWDDARFCAGELCAADYGGKAALLERLSALETHLGGNGTLVLVDSEGVCHGADGTVFRWGDAEALREEGRTFLTLVPGREEEQILFPARLPKALAAEGTVYTHLALVCGMSSLDRVFDVRDFGAASAAYVIRENGSQVYGQEKQNELSGLYNVTAFLGFQETVWSASGNTVAEDLQSGVSACSVFRMDGKRYFAAYEALGERGWRTVLLIPADRVGDSALMNAAVLCMALAALFVLAALALTAVLLGIRERREEASGPLRRAEERERTGNPARNRFPSAASSGSRASRDTGAEEAYKLPPLHVLAVDDDGAFLETAAVQLRSLGVRTDTASNGKTAVEFARLGKKEGQPYDAALVDWHMPEFDGVQTMEALRDVLGRDFPVVLVSASELSALREAGKGADGFLTKPLFRSRLCEELRRVVQTRGEGASET